MTDELRLEGPFDVRVGDAEQLFYTSLRSLTERHAESCRAYQQGIQALFPDWMKGDSLADLPYVPVSAFKRLDLKSVSQEDVFKVLQSSGTTSQTPSRIYLDRETAGMQTKALAEIVTSFIGKERRPMLIADHANVVRDRRSFSARGAGILGLMNFGRQHGYGLKEDGDTDLDALQPWLEKHASEPVLIFGFTFMVWQLLDSWERRSLPPLKDGVLIHSGGWKKLADRAVSREAFNERVNSTLGIPRVHNFYGMVEQVGSVFVECEHGRFHCPHFARVEARDPRSLELRAVGEQGIIQTMSLLPRSYPGHNLLTEDLGVIHGDDDCPCGKKGRTFSIRGRLPKAEVRGCSDTSGGGSRDR